VLIASGSFSALGTSGAMLQMVSHGLIGLPASLPGGATYDRTHTLHSMRWRRGPEDAQKRCSPLWPSVRWPRLALPGMRVSFSELDGGLWASSPKRGLLSQLSGIVMGRPGGGGGVLDADLLPLHAAGDLLGKENPEAGAHKHASWWMPEPARSNVILLPAGAAIIGIGLYPRIVTDHLRASSRPWLLASNR